LLAIAGAARASDTSVHAAGEVSVAYNDNITGAPSDSAQRFDAFSFTLVPGAMLFHATRRLDLSVAYRHPVVLYFDSRQPDESGDIGAIDLQYAASRVDTLRVTLAASRFSENLTTLSDPELTTSAARVTGSTTFFATTLANRYVHELSPSTKFEQFAEGVVSTPIDADIAEPRTYTAQLFVGPRWLLGDHAFFLSVGGRYFQVETVIGDDGVVPVGEPVRHIVVPAALVGWRGQIARHWATGVTAGVDVPFDWDRNVTATPTATAGIYYERLPFGASLEYTRDMTANAQVGRLFVSDTGTLAGYVPLWERQGLVVRGASSVSRHRALALGPGEPDEAATTLVEDVALVWSPPRLGASFGARYQRTDQLDATEGSSLNDFNRNVVSLFVEYFFPERRGR
jgi:hypothetical protein